MSNPLKKTMVYLGLADEDTSYDAPAYAATLRLHLSPLDAHR